MKPRKRARTAWRAWATALLASALAALMTGCALTPPHSCEPSEAQAPLQAVAPGVWLWPGANQEISPANGGHVTASVVLTDAQQAWVIDPGPSRQHGQRLARALACTVHAPLGGIINSHAHAENVLGNQGLLEAAPRMPGVAVWANAATQDSMQRRCPSCLEHLFEVAGQAAMDGTRIHLPDQRLRDGQRIPPGGAVWQVLLLPQAHTEADTVLWNDRARVLIAGGLLYDGRLPELAQGSLVGWLAALDRLAALQPRLAIGQGLSVAPDEVQLPPSFDATRAYLSDLRALVLGALDRGESPASAERLELPAYRHWAGYRERHAFNVQRAWRELEPRWMDGLR